MGQAGSTYNAGEDKPSYSAMVQAGIRYLGLKERDPFLRTKDDLSVYFLEGPYKVFTIPLLRSTAIAVIESKWPGGYGFSCVRSRIGDKQFEDFDGDQIVNLGSGFCTRPQRFSLRPDVTVFELDRPGTLAKKTRILKKIDAAGRLNKNVQKAANKVFRLPIDFTKQSLEDVLLKHPSYDPVKKTLVIWEGVSMYITKEAVDATFSFVLQHCKLGSLILFDYCDKTYIESDGLKGNFYGGPTLLRTAKAKNENFTFGIEFERLDEWLKERGFEKVKSWQREELESSFLIDSKGKLVHKADGPLAICLAQSACLMPGTSS